MPASPTSIELTQFSNDLRENETLYAEEITNLAALGDIRAAGGSLMEVNWLEGATEQERDQSLQRYEMILDARGEKIDALLAIAETQAERAANQQVRLQRMQSLRTDEPHSPAYTPSQQQDYAQPRGPAGVAPQGGAYGNHGAIRGPVMDPGRRAVDITQLDPSMVNMDYLRGTTPPASIMGRDGQLLGGTLGGIRNATMHPMEFVLRALGGNIHNLRNYNGPYASVEGGIWMNANEVNLRAINLNASGGLSNAAIQQQPTLYEGPDPIYLTDFVPSIDTSMTSLTWDDTISLAATLPTRKSVGEEAEDADPTTVKETITVSRQPMTIKLDNMLLMSPIAAAEYATMIMNQTWGVIGSNEIMNGDGSAPNQQGIFDRIGSGATYRKNFSRGTGNIYANFIRAVNQAQAERVKRGFIGGEVVVEPLLLYALLDYRESGRPVFNSDVWPIRKFGLTWYPTLGLQDNWASANNRQCATLMNFAGNSINWVQGMNMKMLDQLSAKSGQTEVLLEVYNMYQFRQVADIRVIQSAS